MFGNRDKRAEEKLERLRARREEQRAAEYRIPDMQTRKQSSGSGKKRARLHFTSRWISGFFMLVFTGALGFYAFAPMFRVTGLELKGMSTINREEADYFTGVKNLPIFMIDPEHIEQVMTGRYENIRGAEVSLELPNRVEVMLRERIAAVMWDFGGSQFLIDDEGRVLEEGHVTDDTIRIVADSFPGGSDKADRDIPQRFSADTFHSMLTMGSLVPEGKTLYFTFDNGYGWDTDDGWRIFYGKNDTDIEEKLRMAESIGEYLRKEEIEPVIVSLEFKDAPYYRYSE